MKVAFLSVTLVLGCSASSTPLPDPEGFVTIHEGIYGATTQRDDVGASSEQPLGGFRILVFDHVPAPGSSALASFTAESPLATVASDDRGLFELALTPKKYVLCSTFGRCVWFDVKAGSPSRIDYQMSVGSGWSRGERVTR